MRRTLTILSLLLVSTSFIACGGGTTGVSNTNSGNGSSSVGTANGGSAGSGPQNQGIGGTSESNSSVVNGNTYTVPPGFNSNGDRGSASNVSGKP